MVSSRIIPLFLVVDKSIENIIAAHESEIGALTVNAAGTLIASASTKVNYPDFVYVFDRELLSEFSVLRVASCFRSSDEAARRQL